MTNVTVLQGRFTKDPEWVQVGEGNVSKETFRLAVQRDYKAKSEEKPAADFINCIAWRSTADFIDKHFNKGDMILVQGRLQSRSWEGDDGQNHYVVELVVDQANFCGPKAKENGTAPASNEQPSFPDEASFPDFE